jgi:hypothetical protein
VQGAQRRLAGTLALLQRLPPPLLLHCQAALSERAEGPLLCWLWRLGWCLQGQGWQRVQVVAGALRRSA